MESETQEKFKFLGLTDRRVLIYIPFGTAEDRENVSAGAEGIVSYSRLWFFRSQGTE